MFVDNMPCVPCGLLSEGFTQKDGHPDLETIAVWSGYQGKPAASRLRCRECGVVWLHDDNAGWRIHDPDGLLDGFVPSDKSVRGRVARA